MSSQAANAEALHAGAPHLVKGAAMLRAVADAATILFGSQDYEAVIVGVLKSVGEVVEIDRITLRLFLPADEGSAQTARVCEWHKPNLEPLAKNAAMMNVRLEDLYSDSQFSALTNGEVVRSCVEQFPRDLQATFKDFGFLSNLVSTAAIESGVYCSLSFSDAKASQRPWTDAEVDTLKTLTGLIAAAIGRTRQHRERERTLTNLKLRNRALEGISQGVTIMDLYALEKPIIYTNPAFVAMSKYPMAEIIGRSGNELFASIDGSNSILNSQFYRMLGQKGAVRAESQFRRKDGTTFLNSTVTSLIYDEQGNVTHIVTVHEDITDIRRREELVLEAQRMESVGQLTGGIAHDFNNLLTAIKSNAEDLRDDLKDNRIQHMQAEIILTAADRGAGLVAQLMAFARKQELKPVNVDVNPMIENLAKLLRSNLPRDIVIEIKATDNLPAVLADPPRLETAILNLAFNARDAMPEGGKLTLETSIRTLDADYLQEHLGVQEGKYVLIAVTDTGTGMSTDVVERAFVPFFTTKEVGKGTGLGLSMVYGFVKQSGGHAMIYSEVGVGTVVKIYLPAVDNDASAMDVEAAAKAVAGAGTILLVEDDQTVRQSIANKLTRFGYTVMSAKDAVEAIALLERRPHFDLVFSDVVMPGPMNGGDLVREVRRRWPAINVLLTSGFTESTVAGKIDLPEDVSLLSKPYSSADLTRAISGAIKRS